MRTLLATVIFISATVLSAETSCTANLAVRPANAASASRYQVIVEAYVNDAGPYQFLLDTGSQITMIDETLASELRIKPSTSAAVVGVSLHGKGGRYGLADSVRVGENAKVGSSWVLVLDMKEIHAAGYPMRGLIGEDFLSHFDATIDNTHSRVCFTKISN